LHVGQNQEIASPCSLNIIPKHLGHWPISSLMDFCDLYKHKNLKIVQLQENKFK